MASVRSEREAMYETDQSHRRDLPPEVGKGEREVGEEGFGGQPPAAAQRRDQFAFARGTRIRNSLRACPARMTGDC